MISELHTVETNFNQGVDVQHQPWVHEVSVGLQEPLISHTPTKLQPSPLSCFFPRTFPGRSGAIFRSHLFLVLEAPGRMNFNPPLLWVTRLSKDSEERELFPGLTRAKSHWLCRRWYFVLRPCRSLLLSSTPEPNHSDRV